MSEPIRIFIGCSANDEDLEFQAVVHYSLETYATQPLEITWMKLSRDPDSFWYADPEHRKGWRTDGWATPFSALRWGIPAACNFQGRAIYMDLDMIARDDIAKLHATPFEGRPMVSKHEAICVTMYDCAAMRTYLPPINEIKHTPGLYRTIRKEMSQPQVIRRYEGNWNCLDMRRDGGGEYASVDDPEIKVLHFTEIPTQPHLRHALPRCQREGITHWYKREQPRAHKRQDAVALFDRMLNEAIDNGYALDNYRTQPRFGDYGR